jgi:hypothetical protein
VALARIEDRALSVLVTVQSIRHMYQAGTLHPSWGPEGADPTRVGTYLAELLAALVDTDRLADGTLEDLSTEMLP